MQTRRVRQKETYGTDALVALCKRWMMVGSITIACTVPLIAQNEAVQQKLAEVKQSVAENKQKLHQYQWIETTQLTLKGDPKPPSQNLCQYDAAGQVLKTPIGPPPRNRVVAG